MIDKVLLEWGGTEVTAMEVYSDIFQLGKGLIQRSDEEPGEYKANPLVYYKNDDEEHGHYRILFEDTFAEIIEEAQQADFTLINGITYFGRKNIQQHASKMYAMIFDLDSVDDDTVTAFLSGSLVAGVYPCPNYVVLSGSGLHLYYIFREPVSLFPNIKLQLKELKYALTDKMWNPYTSREKKPQHQGINQGFRMIGGKTKAGSQEEKVRAFKLNSELFTLSELCQYVPEEFRVDESKLFKESKYTLSDAKEKFPLWYEKVIVQGNKRPVKWDIKGKVNGDNPYALYDWWLRQIKSGATYGHRYFCIMALVIYAVKNDVPYEKVKKDSYELMTFLNALNPSEPFSEEDIKSALECYDERYYTFPRKDISKLTAIVIEPNKRNGRKQSQHMKIVNEMRRFKRDVLNEDEYRNSGRPTSEEVVRTWQKQNPSGRKADCTRATGLDPKTVRKWWL